MITADSHRPVTDFAGEQGFIDKRAMHKIFDLFVRRLHYLLNNVLEFVRERSVDASQGIRFAWILPDVKEQGDIGIADLIASTSKARPGAPIYIKIKKKSKLKSSRTRNKYTRAVTYEIGICRTCQPLGPCHVPQRSPRHLKWLKYLLKKGLAS